MIDQNVSLIAIFGATGTGKTSFVNDASGGDLRVGHNSHACTKDVEQSPVFRVDNRSVVLFDTPGFDDTHLSDTEILKRISGFLAASHSSWRISLRTFNVFRKLCGKDSLSNRENELRTHVDFFLPAIEQGATMVRRTHKNQQSAHSIIRMLLEKNPITMQVQEEIVNQGKALSDTGAGREVEHELIMAAEKHKAEMSELKTEMEEALKDRDERTQKELAQYQLDAKAAEEKRQTELAALRKGYDDEQVRWQQQAEEARAQQKAMEAGQQALRDELQAARRQHQEASQNQRLELQKRIADLEHRVAHPPGGCIIA
ncbi:50S ribosome-binding GTPase [Rhizoctonia solani]|uniref:50S ribosome-binding GTPase n=1 Tax=Rhizoctonia solani TaxID=456999 RepID=A0A8H7M0Z6_9AGAM|nr:50S ribosome-binding GTPase [Rhizoctonia solani]